jgi:hypothetical protein
MLYLDCSCLNLSLGIFLDFCDFLGIFRASKHFLGISWICSCTEKYFEKKENLPYRIVPSQRPDPTRSARTGPTRQPAVAHLSRPSARGRGLHGRPPPLSACAPRLVVRAYKGGAEPPRAPLRALSRPAPPPPCEPAAPPPCWSSTKPRVPR